MRKRPPMRGIDLEEQMRAALCEQFRHSSEPSDQQQVISRLAHNVVPKIWSEPEPDAVSQLIELAVDLPELLTRKPEADHIHVETHFQETPLLLLHANVLALAESYGRAELTRFPDLGTMSRDALHLYGIMRRRYVLQGHHSNRVMTARDVLQELQVPPELWEEEEARAVLTLLIEVGVVERKGQAGYQLTLPQCYELLERYHLETKCHPLRCSEYERVRQAITRV